MSGIMDSMGDVLGIAIVGGIAMKAADMAFGQNQNRPSKKRKKKIVKPATRIIGNSYEEELRRRVFGT